jgi:hypothetical protein
MEREKALDAALSQIEKRFGKGSVMKMGESPIPIRHLTSNGGRVTWSVRVHNAEWCAWSSSPNVAGFNATVKCKSGMVERSFKFGANTSTKAKDYTLSLTVLGKTKTVGDLTTGGMYPLADFGSVTFTDLGLTVPSGSWTLPPYSDGWEMVAPDGSVEALPSPIQGSGASTTFTVTYETPGEITSTAGTASMKHPQSTFVAPARE